MFFPYVDLLANMNSKLLKEIRNAWKEIEHGKFKEFSKEEFLKELKKW